ncbi:hypothetical protein EXU48_02525 [Occultella glacieicola]|uniref:Uncharacterized protein n=1 Tax=Occultella glacieicola TaxID=2518684 RepID=A0ABY2E991_9MICO|nr:hypothetical protein [Occultella glacieicola]TDE99074.1 hypothetical protein EXU48_02525 [Occultella glacieicola]
MTYQGAGGPGVPGAHPPPVVKTSTKGPRILTFVGIGLVVAATALVAIVVFAFNWDQSVLSPDGSPGPTVAVVVDVPGEGVVEVSSSADHAVYLTHPTGDPVPELAGRVLVHAPSGEVLELESLAVGETSEGGVSAEFLGVFHPSTTGEYRIEVPATLDGSAATVLVRAVPGDYDGLGQVVFAAIAVPAAIGLGAIGFAMGVGGGIWWSQRAAAGRRASHLRLRS